MISYEVMHYLKRKRRGREGGVYGIEVRYE